MQYMSEKLGGGGLGWRGVVEGSDAAYKIGFIIIHGHHSLISNDFSSETTGPNFIYSLQGPQE